MALNNLSGSNQSSFVCIQRARTFLADNAQNPDGRWHVVNFLLNLRNALGIENRISIDDILVHLESHGISLSREQFQQTILGELKRQGILMTLPYPGGRGGVFIPTSEDEARRAAAQVLERIESEIENIRGVTDLMSWRQLITSLQDNISQTRRKL